MQANTTARTYLWRTLDEPAMQHLTLTANAEGMTEGMTEGVVADAIMLGLIEGAAFRLVYRVEAAPDFRVRAVSLALMSEGQTLERRCYLDDAGRTRTTTRWKRCAAAPTST